ncbi:MAG: ATP-binding cassette domain-containing protein [Prevotella sp.]|nr:ATP-binding cassette domain-containing protein [Prevotella sp.]
MEKQEIIAVIGLNASGKTQWADRLRKQLASDSVRYIAFCDSYGASTDRSYYLQLRWNQHDIDAETPVAGQVLERSFLLTGPDDQERRTLQAHLYDLFEMRPLLDKYVITLSSGELRKLQLIKTLLARPRTLILDNPFIGLDAETREQLKALLKRLSDEQQLTLYLVLSRAEDVPDYVMRTVWMTPEALFRSAPAPLSDEKREALLRLPTHDDDYQAATVADLRQVSIRYGERTILRNLDWTILNGQRWALSGQNGSGKSTLLSLICADNPQAYACDITLFGRQRGSGESIWDIKRHIGYVSPEMHRSYQRNLPCLQIVASGLKDTVGLYTRANEAEQALCRWWMWLFGVDHLADRPFLALSSGEQRLVLLARAFVKDPELLILDEPLHGLDARQQRLAKDIIDTFCRRPNKTLIMVTHYEAELPSCITHRKYLNKQL